MMAIVNSEVFVSRFDLMLNHASAASSLTSPIRCHDSWLHARTHLTLLTEAPSKKMCERLVIAFVSVFDSLITPRNPTDKMVLY